MYHRQTVLLKKAVTQPFWLPTVPTLNKEIKDLEIDVNSETYLTRRGGGRKVPPFTEIGYYS